MKKSITIASTYSRSRLSYLTWLAAFIVMYMGSITACSTVSTSAKLRDPSQVGVSIRRLGRSSLHPIRPGGGDFTMELQNVGVEQPGSLRKENNSITLECATCVDGTLPLVSDKGMTAAAKMSVSDIIDSKKTFRSKMKLGYEYNVTENVGLFPELETPWTNVEYYEQTSKPVRWLAWSLVPGGAATIAGVVLLALEEPGGGVPLLIVGLALDALGVIQLVKSPVTEQFEPNGELREPPPPSVEAEPKEEKAEPKAKASPAPQPKAKEEPAEEKAAEPVKEKEEKEEAAPAKETKGKKKAEEKKESKPEKKAAEKKESEPEKKADEEKESKPEKKGKKNERLDDFLL
jgi:hypothetical protein